MPKAQTTPMVEISEKHFHGRVAVLWMPFNEHYCILEGKTLPAKLAFPRNFPRTYSVVDVPKSGAHAHRPGTEKEIMVCLHGQATVAVTLMTIATRASFFCLKLSRALIEKKVCAC
jgi:hypothetical protein